MDDDFDNDDWIDQADDESFDDPPLTCPECRAEAHIDAEACSACGYWFTEADHTAAWRANSASGRIITIGLWALGLAGGVWLLTFFG